jgi:hypothetical protein
VRDATLRRWFYALWVIVAEVMLTFCPAVMLVLFRITSVPLVPTVSPVTTTDLIKDELRRRMHRPIPEQGAWIEQVVRGFFAYHAVPTNGAALKAFAWLLI